MTVLWSAKRYASSDFGPAMKWPIPDFSSNFEQVTSALGNLALWQFTHSVITRTSITFSEVLDRCVMV